MLVSVTNYGCKKKESSGEVPTVVTGSHTNVTSHSADCSGTITSIGSSGITSSGIECSVREAVCGIGGGPLFTGAYTITVEFSENWACALYANTDYSYRAYATNSVGTGYGKKKYFKTLP